eukprot:6467053-Amphidinium_carterae.2
MARTRLAAIPQRELCFATPPCFALSASSPPLKAPTCHQEYVRLVQICTRYKGSGCGWFLRPLAFGNNIH